MDASNELAHEVLVLIVSTEEPSHPNDEAVRQSAEHVAFCLQLELAVDEWRARLGRFSDRQLAAVENKHGLGIEDARVRPNCELDYMLGAANDHVPSQRRLALACIRVD